MGILALFSAFILLANGVILTFKSGFFQFKHLEIVFKVTFKKLIKSKDLKGFKAMALALGSTIGIGNIVGVTSAVIIGGAGAVFWMLLSGFAGMIIKFAETFISVKDKIKNERKSGGPMYVLKAHCKGILKELGYLFAIFCVCASFFAGNIIQSKSIYRFAEIGFNINVI